MIPFRSNFTCRLCARKWQHDGITAEVGGYPQTQTWLADGCVCGGRLEEDCGLRRAPTLKCDGCGQDTAKYHAGLHQFQCPCGHHSEPQQGKPGRCFKCGGSYTEYTWFDPSGCPHCFRSFVD